MPRLVHPSGMPQEVNVAIDVIGNRARTETLRALAIHGPLTLTEVAEAIGVGRSGAHVHLAALERAGLIDADLSPAERRGRTVRWALNGDALDRLLRTLGEYLAGR